MRREPNPPSSLGLPRSTLIYGQGEAAMTLLAAGLARRTGPGFGWANCSGSTSGWEPSVRAALEAGSAGRRVEVVVPEEFASNEVRARSLDAVVDSHGLTQEGRERLVDFLRLPDLFQRLVASRPTGTLLSALVLTNVDVLPRPLVRDTLEDPRLHHELRTEGVSLVVTFRGSPPPSLEAVFDRLFRVDPPSDGSWLESFVRPERGEPSEDPPLAGPLRVCWQRLGLDPRLLPDRGPGS